MAENELKELDSQMTPDLGAIETEIDLQTTQEFGTIETGIDSQTAPEDFRMLETGDVVSGKESDADSDCSGDSVDPILAEALNKYDCSLYIYIY